MGKPENGFIWSFLGYFSLAERDDPLGMTASFHFSESLIRFQYKTFRQEIWDRRILPKMTCKVIYMFILTITVTVVYMYAYINTYKDIEREINSNDARNFGH